MLDEIDTGNQSRKFRVNFWARLKLNIKFSKTEFIRILLNRGASYQLKFVQD